MLKSVIAALAVSAAALFSIVMATPSFASTAATTDKPLVIGPHVTITVSCAKGHHAVARSGTLSCVLDKKKHKTINHKTSKHKAAKHITSKPKTAVQATTPKSIAPKPAIPAPAIPPRPGALGPWHYCWHHSAGPAGYWAVAGDHTWL